MVLSLPVPSPSMSMTPEMSVHPAQGPGCCGAQQVASVGGPSEGGTRAVGTRPSLQPPLLTQPLSTRSFWREDGTPSPTQSPHRVACVFRVKSTPCGQLQFCLLSHCRSPGTYFLPLSGFPISCFANGATSRGKIFRVCSKMGSLRVGHD